MKISAIVVRCSMTVSFERDRNPYDGNYKTGNSFVSPFEKLTQTSSFLVYDIFAVPIVSLLFDNFIKSTRFWIISLCFSSSLLSLECPLLLLRGPIVVIFHDIAWRMFDKLILFSQKRSTKRSDLNRKRVGRKSLDETAEMFSHSFWRPNVLTYKKNVISPSRYLESTKKRSNEDE